MVKWCRITQNCGWTVPKGDMEEEYHEAHGDDYANQWMECVLKHEGRTSEWFVDEIGEREAYRRGSA